MATNKLIKEGAESLIIDVRGNPGGYLHTVGDIARQFVAGGYDFRLYARCGKKH